MVKFNRIGGENDDAVWGKREFLNPNGSRILAVHGFSGVVKSPFCLAIRLDRKLEACWVSPLAGMTRWNFPRHRPYNKSFSVIVIPAKGEIRDKARTFYNPSITFLYNNKSEVREDEKQKNSAP